ncbi:MAG: CBS domain-containing protein [Nitrospirota bacterium]
MQSGKATKDIMIGIFEYPHIPYWFSVSQAMRIIKVSFLSTKKYPEPISILVFDEKYNLVGTVGLREILKGIEPKLGVRVEGDEPSQWENLFKEAKTFAEKTLGEIMVPAKAFAEPHESITKAAYLMLRNDVPLLPVLEDKKKLVGVVRMVEIFSEIADEMLKE